MFRATVAVLSKASRMPLNSKQANKEYYKGTGSFPGLGRKRTGRHSPSSKAPYILMAERLREFVVPEGLNECVLQPYVSRETKITRLQALDWPIAHTKKDGATSKRKGTFSDKGFDGEYYLQLAEFFEEKGNGVVSK